jgi:ribonucleoside-diphosphate reductase alpha chain
MHEPEPSPFITVRAVEAWDTWFRWRDDGGLRDLAVETTWQRVAAALAAAETAGRARFEAALYAAQACWQLVLDERILAHAGTGAPLPDDPVAALNAAAFVDLSVSTAPAFDFAAFGEVAALAVHCLDNVHCAAGRAAPNLRVGIIGLADALLLLGNCYDSAEGRLTAAAIARALAAGCLRGSIALAEQRGADPAAAAPQIERSRARGLPQALIDSIALHGVRHRNLTAIARHPRLAAFANNVSDAIDPIGCGARAAAVAANSPRTATALPFALLRLQGGVAATTLSALLVHVTAAGQIRLRDAMQPWIDHPIAYPPCAPASAPHAALAPDAPGASRAPEVTSTL